jgi:hypothetical protein
MIGMTGMTNLLCVLLKQRAEMPSGVSFRVKVEDLSKNIDNPKFKVRIWFGQLVNKGREVAILTIGDTWLWKKELNLNTIQGIAVCDVLGTGQSQDLAIMGIYNAIIGIDFKGDPEKYLESLGAMAKRNMK